MTGSDETENERQWMCQAEDSIWQMHTIVRIVWER